MRVVVAGASGLIGSALTRALRERGDAAVALPRFASAPWSVEGADTVVNLAGASVAAEVLSQEMGDKIYIQKMRRRKNFRRRTGHRQMYTRVRIGAITA